MSDWKIIQTTRTVLEVQGRSMTIREITENVRRRLPRQPGFDLYKNVGSLLAQFEGIHWIRIARGIYRAKGVQ